MKREVKDLWVKALRSGEFVQTKEKLESSGKYCALGVLASLALVNGICMYEKGGKFDGRSNSLSYNIQKWAEIDFDEETEELKLTKGAGKVPFWYKGVKTSIADLNDRSMSFVQIADIIEKNWMDL